MRRVKDDLAAATTDFGARGEAIFGDEVEWTITGYGVVARTFHGIKDLIDNAEQALCDRWDAAVAVATKGAWAMSAMAGVSLASAMRAPGATDRHLHGIRLVAFVCIGSAAGLASALIATALANGMLVFVLHLSPNFAPGRVGLVVACAPGAMFGAAQVGRGAMFPARPASLLRDR